VTGIPGLEELHARVLPWPRAIAIALLADLNLVARFSISAHLNLAGNSLITVMGRSRGAITPISAITLICRSASGSRPRWLRPVRRARTRTRRRRKLHEYQEGREETGRAETGTARNRPYWVTVP
jgi:hypothetical protein